MKRWVCVAALVVAGVVASVVGNGWRESTVGASDALLDWMVVDAIRGEGSPHDRLDVLFRNHGYSAPTETHSHPRAPGALLLQTPLLLVDKYDARSVMTVISIVSVVVVILVSEQLTGWPIWVLVAIGGFLFFSVVMQQTFVFGVQSALVAALIALAWWLLDHDRDAGAGALLGVAATLKLFPALLLVILWRSRPTTLRWGIGVAIVLNLIGLALPDVSLTGTLDAFRSAHEVNLVNPLNFGVPVWMTVAGTVVTVWALRRHDVTWQLVFGSLTMVLLSSTAWIHYMVMWMLPLLIALSRTTTGRKLAGRSLDPS